MILTGLGWKTEKLFKDLIYAFTMVIRLRINGLFEPTSPFASSSISSGQSTMISKYAVESLRVELIMIFQLHAALSSMVKSRLNKNQ